MMHGVATIRQLLTGDAGVTALVDPAARPSRIAGGVLARGVALPALAIEEISSVDRTVVSPGAVRHVRSRVQVTAMARTYPELQALIAAVKSAGDHKFPAMAGVANVTVRPDGAGPDFMNESASIHLKTQDFIVTYSEAR